MNFRGVGLATAWLAVSCTSRVESQREVGDRAAPVLAALNAHPELRASIAMDSSATLRVDLPTSAADALRIDVAGRPGFSLAISPLVDDAHSIDRDGVRVFRDVATDTSLAFVSSRSAVEELRVLDSAAAPHIARWKLAVGPAVASLRVREGRVELLDANGYVALASAPMFLVDRDGRRRDVVPTLHDDVLEAKLELDGLAFPVVVDPVWAMVPSLKDPRHYHSSLRLGDGRVMVTGGNSTFAGGALSTSEIYDPKTNTWSQTGSLTTPRAAHQSVIVKAGVASGRPVVVGGGTTAEWYDLAAGTFSAIAPLASAKNSPQVLSITSFVVAITGASIERWNSYDNTWATMPAPTGAPALVQAVALKDNRILIVHTMKDFTTQDCLDRVEILDVLASPPTLTAAAPLPTKRCIGSLTVLNDGKVLAATGNVRDTAYSQVDLYDPTANSWKSVAAKPAYKGGHKAALLGSGRVLFIGGYATDPMNNVSEIYDPVADTWGSQLPWTTARILTGVTSLNSGGVLVTGGNAMMTSKSIAEVFDEGATTCAKNEDCPARLCVDGVCCDRACDGQCEACDVPGSVGTCTLVTGAPRGMRTACDSGGGDVCRAKVCDGKDAKSCAAFAPNTTECKPASCADATFTAASKCDGAGSCTASLPKACAPYNCAATGCLDACDDSSQCAAGLICKSRACVPGCSEDKRNAVAPTGADVPCNAYLCDPAAGACRTTCTSSAECAPGNVCDLASKSCAPLQADGGGDDGGCTMGAGRGSDTFLLSIVLAGLWLRRRRTAHSPSQPS